MNSTLFNRKWAVTLSPPGSSVGTKYTDLRVNFDIEKRSESTANKAKIEVYNFNSISRSLFRAGFRIKLEAGYGTSDFDTNLGIVYDGDIPSGPKGSISMRRGADVVTVFECGEAERTIYDATFRKSYPPKTRLSSVLFDICKAFRDEGVPTGNIKGVVDKVYNQGVVFSQSLKFALDTITRAQKLSWSVQAGALQIYPIGRAYQSQAIVLSSGAGIVPSPILPGSDLARLSQTNTGLIGIPSKGDKAVIFEALMNPALHPGCLVQLISEQVFGFFVVTRAQFQGDSHGDRWQVKCEAVQTIVTPLPQQNFAGQVITSTEGVA